MSSTETATPPFSGNGPPGLAPPVNDRREIFGWAMYDWANSAFYTTVITTFLGPYFIKLAEQRGGTIEVFGLAIHKAAFYPWLFALSVLVQVILLPVLGAIADFSSLKKHLMMAFAYAGALCAMLLFWLDGERILFGGLLFMAANICFGGAIVFYNAFLPEIASPDRRDAVSSKGFALGYVGGGLLLFLNLVLFSVLSDQALAVRLSLASAGAWWLVFTLLFPQRRLRERRPAKKLPPGESYFTYSFKQLSGTLKELFRKYPATLKFLVAFLIYNDGIQTVIVVANQFATDELKIEASTGVQVVLMIQFVAFAGSLGFNWLAGRIGAKKAVLFNLLVWTGLVVYAYFFFHSALQFWILGAVLALILGGSQALSRSLFSQMIPREREAEYFSFYEISDRGTSWVGKAVFGAAAQITGTQRVAVLSLILFFVAGMVLLAATDVRKAIREAGNEPPEVI
ncbi:MAG: MFS transporter [Planctomycetes bacterium]|nr:MFS transporter [Planctomycetota bacterium]